LCIWLSATHVFYVGRHTLLHGGWCCSLAKYIVETIYKSTRWKHGNQFGNVIWSLKNKFHISIVHTSIYSHAKVEMQCWVETCFHRSMLGVFSSLTVSSRALEWIIRFGLKFPRFAETAYVTLLRLCHVL